MLVVPGVQTMCFFAAARIVQELQQTANALVVEDLLSALSAAPLHWAQAGPGSVPVAIAVSVAVETAGVREVAAAAAAVAVIVEMVNVGYAFAAAVIVAVAVIVAAAVTAVVAVFVAAAAAVIVEMLNEELVSVAAVAFHCVFETMMICPY